MSWPKDFKIVHKSRPGTFAARMDSRSLEWHFWSAKRYSYEEAHQAVSVLMRHHSGSDWGVMQVGNQR